jgi:hypothetical protein
VKIREFTRTPYITNDVKGQKMQWFGHEMKIEETNKVRASI